MKVRIYPNRQQRLMIHKTFGCCRLVFNLLLDAKIKAYECGDSLSAYDLKKRLVPMKESADGWFLKEVDSMALQNAVLKIGVAYENFFRRIRNGKKGGYPGFKKKHDPRQSYQSSTAKIVDGKLYLPKVGKVKAKFHRGVPDGKVKTVTVSFEAGHYYASINYDDGYKMRFGKNNGKTVGIDVGVKIFACTSENEMIEPVNLDREIEKVRRMQKALSRKKRGSNNRSKARQKLAKAHLKLRNKRDDFLHKVSRRLSENQTVVVEDLNIKSMSAKAKGSTDNPNMRAKSKRGLNRAILQQSWGKFFTMLSYKLEKNGGQLVKVDPRFTSQKCSRCGHIEKENRRSQEVFVCKKCGYKANADYNAALNIRSAAGTVVKAFLYPNVSSEFLGSSAL